MIAIDRRRPRPGEPGSEAEADGPDSQPLDTPEPAQLRPNITATTANGPFAQVPTPQIGAPNSQPVLRAPEPTTPPAPSVAQMALGTSETAVQRPVAPKVNTAPLNPAWLNTTTAGGPQGQVAPGSMIPPTPQGTGGYQPGNAYDPNKPESRSNVRPPVPGEASPFGGVIPPAGGPPAPTPRVGAPSPIATLSGDWTPPVAAAGSAPLIASAAGGTMSAAGDAANPFRGYQTEQGGKFGGYDSVPLANDPSGRTFKQYDQDFVKNANALKQVPPLSREEFAAMTASDSGANAVKDKIANGQPVSDKELAFVRQARGMELQQDTAAPTFGTFGTKAGNATAADPAEQARALAAWQPTPQIAPPPGTGGYDPGNAGGGVTALPGGVQNVPAGPSGGVSGGAPVVGGGPSGAPAFPSTPAPGVGAPGDLTNLDPVQQAMRDETLRRLQNPSPYDDALWQKEVDRAKLLSDEQWKRNRDSLDADLAARGINFSSIAGDKLSDFNTARSRSWDDILTGFLSDRAKGIGSARDQAFNAGNTERTYYDDQRQRGIDNQFDVTKLQEALRQGQEGTALDWTQLGLNALGQGTSGAADLGAGAAASAGNTDTTDYLTQWLAQFYGNKKPTPQTGAPSTVNYGMQ